MARVSGPGRVDIISTCNKRYTKQQPLSLWIICGGSFLLGHFRFPLSLIHKHTLTALKKPKTLTLSVPRVLSPSPQPWIAPVTFSSLLIPIAHSHALSHFIIYFLFWWNWFRFADLTYLIFFFYVCSLRRSSGRARRV